MAPTHWGPHGWASGKGKQLRGRGMEVRETSLAVEDDSKRESAFLIRNVQKACLSDQVQLHGR